MKAGFELIPYEDHQFWGANLDGGIVVAVKPVCERMGMDWSAQFRRIKRHHVLSQFLVVMAIPSPGGEQETVCLTLEGFYAWILTISPDRITDENIRALVIRYQKNAFRVIFEHFAGPINRLGKPQISISRGIDLRKQVRAAMFDYKAAESYGQKLVHYSTLQSAMGELGFDTPTMALLDPRIDDGQQLLLDQFWAEVENVTASGHIVNHSRQNNMIALNLPELRRLFVEQGIDFVIDRSVTAALRQSESPKFVASKPVNCKDGKVRECWVFNLPIADLPLVNHVG